MTDVSKLLPFSSMLLLFLQGCGLFGCSARHWGGDTAGLRPGVRLEGRGLFTPPSLDVTSDCNASLDELESDKIKIKGARFGQSASAVVQVEPAKLDAIARVQQTQVEYVGALLAGIRDIVKEVVPVLKLLALAHFADTDSGMTLTLPNGISLGQRSVRNAGELRDVILQTMRTAETAVEVPGNLPVASQPAHP